MMHRPTVVLLLILATLRAQDVPAPVPGAPPLPAANSAEATALLDKALAKMQAVGCGRFRTHELQDLAMDRSTPQRGNWGIETVGGWSQDLSWSRVHTDNLVQCGGRLLVMTAGGWKLRRRTLPSGEALPFAIDPSLLFRVVSDQPKVERQVRHVGVGEVESKRVAILSVTMGGEVASDFIACGAVPVVNGFGSMFVVPGVRPGVPPQYRLHLAFFVDPEGGDLLRFAARMVEDVGILMGGNGRATAVTDGGAAETEVEKEPAPVVGAPAFTNGFPSQQPKRTESVMTYTVDFSHLGFADVPALDDKAKTLLRLGN